MDFRRVGHFHQQSQGQVLFHHEARPQAARRRRRLLATALRGYGPRAGSAGGERQQMIDEVRQGFHRLRSLFRRARQDRELDAEMSAHLELAIEENLERGLSPAEARRQALVRFGGPQQVKESHREARGLPLLETLLQDFRFALRMLRRSPGFALVAIFCLTLGIGANAAVFSWMEGLLFRPYPAVAHQERLLALTGTAQADRTALSWPDFLDLQRNCKLFDAFFVSKIMGTTLSIGDRAQVATGSIVSANYSPALGVHPILGRAFEPNEDVGRGAHPVTVISYQLWKERFAGDPQIIGKTQRMNGVLHTIIGVAPEGFYGTFVGWAMKFWVPASMEDTFEAGGYKLEDRSERWIESYGRLKPGVSLEQAQQEVSAVAKRLETDYPATNRGHGVKLWPLWQTPFNNAGTLLPTLGIMLVVVVFVLLIACANVGNLLLVRSFARRHEMTVRMAIGAGRGRLVKQLVTEGLLLSAFGAVGGLLVAHWCRHALVLLFPARGVRGTAVPLASAGYDAPRAQSFQDELLERVKALPGVDSAAFGRMTPLSYGSFSETPIAVDGYQPPPKEQPIVEYNEVGPDYFATMGIPLVSGREFTRADDEKAALVAVVNETMAQRYWQGRSTLGQRLQLKGRWMQVVGIAKDSKYSSVREKPTPFFFVPLRQNSLRGSVLNIRTPLAPQTMATAIAREVHALDSNLAPYEVITMQEQLDRSTSAQMVAVTLVGILGTLALVLAAIGLYGVMSYAVSQSTRELGLRMALGAGASNLLRLVLSRGLALTGAGVLLGAATALLLTRLLGNLLYKVSPRDPVAFGCAFAFMALVSIAACLLPAWRAARTDPMRALRTE